MYVYVCLFICMRVYILYARKPDSASRTLSSDDVEENKTRLETPLS